MHSPRGPQPAGASCQPLRSAPRPRPCARAQRVGVLSPRCGNARYEALRLCRRRDVASPGTHTSAAPSALGVRIRPVPNQTWRRTQVRASARQADQRTQETGISGLRLLRYIQRWRGRQSRKTEVHVGLDSHDMPANISLNRTHRGSPPWPAGGRLRTLSAGGPRRPSAARRLA